MKKILAGILVCIFITTAVMPNVAFAYQGGVEVSENGYCVVVDEWLGGSAGVACLRSESKNNAQSLKEYFQYVKLYLMVESANAEIESLVKYAQATPKDDVKWLLNKVDKIIDRVMKYAESIGAEVDCEYVEYYIDGQYVLIDPLMVVNVSRKGTR